MKKFLVTGYARHGKDTVCGILTDVYGMKFVSSSFFVAERAVRPYLMQHGLTYATLEECYEDRVNHRALWYDAIEAYNTPDKARMGRELLAQNDIYCGLRSRLEFLALKEERAFDISVWVDRSQHVISEPGTSMQILPTDCDYILDNNGDLDALREKTVHLFNNLRRN